MDDGLWVIHYYYYFLIKEKKNSAEFEHTLKTHICKLVPGAGMVYKGVIDVDDCLRVMYK